MWNARLFELDDGSVHVGMVRTRDADGNVTLVNAAGQPVKFGAREIVREILADTSLMPDGLHEALSVQGFIDLFALFAFLRAQGQR